MIYSAFFLTTEDGHFMITANNSAANALERFDDGVDDDNGVDVTFNDAVNAQAYDAASGVTTSGTSVDFANFALRAKQTLRDFASSVNLPITFLHFDGVLGMIAVESINCDDEIILIFCCMSILLKEFNALASSYRFLKFQVRH
jgi:hypothetical protein